MNLVLSFPCLLRDQLLTTFSRAPARGCPSAVVRVWKELSSTPIELCGAGLTNETLEIMSSSETLRVSFITADKSKGSGGFKATWTEVRDTPATCDKFKCASNNYCISPRLKCNGIHNCGKYDDSDEANCKYCSTAIQSALPSAVTPLLTTRPSPASHALAGIKVRQMSDLVMVGIVGTPSVIVFLLFCSFCHRRRRRKKSSDTSRRRSDSSLNATFEIPRPKPPAFDLPPPGLPAYLSADSV